MTAEPAGRDAAPPGHAPEGGAFQAVLPHDQLKPGQGRRVQVGGRLVALWNVDGTVYATDDTCTHERASLSEGELDEAGLQVVCPRHGARFDLRTGKALTLPAYKPLRTYPVKVEGGLILVRLD